jgi:hypothetical protein
MEFDDLTNDPDIKEGIESAYSRFTEYCHKDNVDLEQIRTKIAFACGFISGYIDQSDFYSAAESEDLFYTSPSGEMYPAIEREEIEQALGEFDV